MVPGSKSLSSGNHGSQEPQLTLASPTETRPYWGGEHTEINLQWMESQGEAAQGVKECIDENTQILHDFLKAPGERPPSLVRLFDELDY